MKNILVYVLTFTLLAACAPSPDNPITSPPLEPDMTTVVPGQLPALQNWTPPESPYAPDSKDALFQRGEIFIDSVDLQIMESFPLQFSVKVVGSVPTPCHQLRLTYDALDTDNNIRVSFYSVIDPAMICTQVISNFEIYFPLGSFPTGHYYLIINGTRYAEFDA